MFGLELVVILGITIVVCTGLASRLHIAPPVLLLLGGLLLGFLPALREVSLPPEVVLFLFLPALLFWESLTTSLREIRANLRGIILASTLLVLVTAGVVASIAHVFGMAWGPAWVLGAALAPTDATAVGALTRTFTRRDVTILKAESLINDGTALVIYGIVVGATVGTEKITIAHVSWLVLLAYAGGMLIGAALAWTILRLRAAMDSPTQETVLTFLTPFLAYFIAETIEASGVLAVVTAGLIMSQAKPRKSRAASRRQSHGFWSLSTFLLNASLFVLVGLEMQAAMRSLDSSLIARGSVLLVVISLALVLVRIGHLFSVTYIIRWIDRRPAQRLRRVSHKTRIVNGMAGFRGAVSLAAALGVPLLVASGDPFPERELVIFVTSGVIGVSILVQGLLLPVVVRWAQMTRDTAIDEERYLAERTATEAALVELDEAATVLGADKAVSQKLREDFETHLRILNAGATDGEGDDEVRRDRQYRALRLHMLERRRETVMRLRNEGHIDDTVLRLIHNDMDVEELRLGPERFY
ncbi:Na+/H+ antiporter [Glutamicibacter sp. M10]|uniref:Na+/H+ antiporter n=1 Tax=Glutamicibacter sp. M10 TaxID=3023076 RepID=UPI0021CAA647|nr:Na+/H+ antiporter [Glutamicibacter sp. M10]UXN31361.1 Na+/H+ antiporter [Glutamicibacter sp. M10]